MHESQAESNGITRTASVYRRTPLHVRAARHAAHLVRHAVAGVLGVALLAGSAGNLGAQLPRIPRSTVSPPQWFFQGGGAALGLAGINDGPSGTSWSFSGDPLWLFQAGVGKAVGDGVVIGLTGGYGDIDLVTRRLNAGAAPLPGGCEAICPARMRVYTAMATARAGTVGRGFGSAFDGGIGFTGFDDLRVTRTGERFDGFASRWDFTGVLGVELSYGFSQDFHAYFGQDVGIGFHTKEGLPSGLSRTFRQNSTKFGLRYGFGASR